LKIKCTRKKSPGEKKRPRRLFRVGGSRQGKGGNPSSRGVVLSWRRFINNGRVTKVAALEGEKGSTDSRKRGIKQREDVITGCGPKKKLGTTPFKVKED